MLTKTAINRILRRIMETGGLSQDMEEDIKRLKDELDEREGILKRYGEVYDGEDKEEYEWKEKESTSLKPSEEIKWREKYNEMRERYLDRFFGKDSDFDDIMKETIKDVKRDGEKQTFEELLERREG